MKGRRVNAETIASLRIALCKDVDQILCATVQILGTRKWADTQEDAKIDDGASQLHEFLNCSQQIVAFVSVAGRVGELITPKSV